MRYETLLKIRGLPAQYAVNILDIPKLRRDKIETMVKSLPDTPIKLFTTGEIGGLVKLFDDEYKVENVQGLDYKLYFKTMFGDSPLRLPKSKVVILYDVGLEKAINVEFSARVLTGVLREFENLKQHVIVHSVIPYSKFSTKYGITFANVLNLPSNPEIKIDI